MPGVIAEADRVFLKLRCFAEHVGWHQNVPSVWMPTSDIKGVVHALADQHFIVGWSLSYDEGATAINAMQPIGIEESGKLDGHQRQLHARARAVKHDGSVGLQWVVHTEALAVTDPQQHYDHVDLSWSDGQSKFSTLDLGYAMQQMDASWNPDPLV